MLLLTNELCWCSFGGKKYPTVCVNVYVATQAVNAHLGNKSVTSRVSNTNSQGSCGQQKCINAHAGN